MLIPQNLLRLLVFLFFFFPVVTNAQDTAAYEWKVSSQRTGEGVYELEFSTPGNRAWQLYAPNETIFDVPSTELSFDSSVLVSPGFEVSGEAATIHNPLFDNAPFSIYEGPVSFRARITLQGAPPAVLMGKLSYTYGRGEEFYPLTPYSFSVPLEGGVASSVVIRVDAFDLDNPVSDRGDEGSGGKSLAGIFLLGVLGGFIAVLTSCVFPLIPLTVSFLTKQD